ncbi:MAG TPA: glutathione peroxidase [Actinotalea sp.]|nr:glutathione peroxidase [Actinotalea sp.]
MTTLYDFTATTLSGHEQALSQYRGNVVLVVNTASRCGLAPQLAGLERLYATHRAAGLVVLGFPSEQFAQEYRDAERIAEFCQVQGVTFPMIATVDVNGKDAHPLYRWLRAEAGGVLGDAIKWNFTKFLVGRDGLVVRRYPPTAEPDTIEPDIVALL